MKKIISLLLSLVLVLCVAGCSSSCKDDETANNDPVSSEELDNTASDDWDEEEEEEPSDDEDSSDDEEDYDYDYDQEPWDESDFDESDDPEEEDPSNETSSEPTDDVSSTESTASTESTTSKEDTSSTESTTSKEDTSSKENTSSEDKKDDEAPIDDLYEDAEILSVYNSQTPISTRYHGMSGTIYHPFSFVKDDASGRYYTDKMLETEVARLQSTGVHYVRGWYRSQWLWTDSGWNWNSTRFGYFQDYCKAMESIDVEVMLQIGWHSGHVFGTSTYSTGLADVDYLAGYGEDKYAETSGLDLSGYSDNDARIVTAAYRYGYWIGETIHRLRAMGINNVTSVSYFVEPNNSYQSVVDPTTGKTVLDEEGQAVSTESGHESKEYVLFCRNVRNKLSTMYDNIDATIDHMGGNESLYTEGIEYTLANDPNLFTIHSSHHYPRSSDPITDVIYYEIQPMYEMYIDMVTKAGVRDTTEFWVDEFNTQYNDIALSASIPWRGLHNAMVGIVGQQEGIDNIMLWMLMDQLFTDKTSTGGEFTNGIHMCGHLPSLYNGSTPYAQYYGTGLFMKYNGYKNGTVYATNIDDSAIFSLYVGAVKLEDGSWTISVVNLNTDPMKVVIEFDEAINQTLYSHTYDALSIEPEPEAILAGVDKVYVNVGDKIADTIPGASFRVYTGVKG